MKKQPSKEALALAAAISASELTHAAIGTYLGVTEGQVSHWATGRRPVPIERAEKLAAYLGIEPERICARYAKFAKTANGSNVIALPPAGDDERRHDLVIARLENDVDALRYAMAALVAAMTIHRPAEGAAVAKALRKHAPAKFVKNGFVSDLLRALEQDE